MEATEARTNGENFQIHIHRSVPEEILIDVALEDAMGKCGISGTLDITGWDGVHFVLTTDNCPSLEQVRRFAGIIRDMPRVLI